MVSPSEIGLGSARRHQLRATIALFVTAGIADLRRLAFAGDEMLDARAAVPLSDTVSFGFT